MKIKAGQDRIGSASLFSLAILVMIESHRLSLGDIHNPGPGFVPFYLGLAVAILSILSFLSPDLRPKPKAFWNNWQRGKNIFFIFAGLILYLALFQTLGFYIDTLLLMIYLMKLSGEKGFKRTILVSFLTVVVIYVVFCKLLIIPFPPGSLGKWIR